MLQSLIHWMKLSNIVPTIRKGMIRYATMITAMKVAAITSIMKSMMAAKKSLMRMVTLLISKTQFTKQSSFIAINQCKTQKKLLVFYNKYNYEKDFNVYGNYDCSFLYGGLQ